MSTAPTDKTIVFFDGHCGLCNGVVDFMILRDTSHNLLYSPLQGETAKTLLTEVERTDLNTVIVAHGDRRFKKSDAVFRALTDIGGVYKLLASVGRIFPKFVRDRVYDFVAQNRYDLFGRSDTCRLPSAEERALFLP
jgi:predicted DCC family thiol-disulfide oxidoreductase YuxK